MFERRQNQVTTVNRQAWFTLAILSSTLLVVFFSETMLLPAIPEIMQEFSIPYATAAWIFSAYLIVAAVMTPIAGKMSDTYGKKKILLVLLSVYVAGITAGGFSDNISFLLASRIIQGVGLAAVPAAFSLLRDTFPPARLATAVGVFGSAYSAGSVVGLLAGATIIQNLGWHYTFFTIVPFAGAVTIMIAKFVREKKEAGRGLDDVGTSNHQDLSNGKRASHSIDLKGALTLSITIISFLLALTLIESGINSSNLRQIEAAFVVSAISLIIFVVIEKKVASPLVDLRLLKDRILLPAFIILVATGITMFMQYPAIVQLVRSPSPLGFGGSAVDAAKVQLPFMIMFLIFSSITPLIINRMGGLNPIILGTIVSIAGSVGLILFHSAELAVAANLSVIASGLSLTITATWNVIVSSSPKLFIGISVGVGALLLFLGMAIGPALTGVYLQNHQTIDGVPGSYPTRESYNWVYLTSGLLSTLSLAFVLILKKRVSRNEIELVAP